MYGGLQDLLRAISHPLRRRRWPDGGTRLPSPTILQAAHLDRLLKQIKTYTVLIYSPRLFHLCCLGVLAGDST